MESIRKSRVEKSLIEERNIGACVERWVDLIINLDGVCTISWPLGTVYADKSPVEAEVQGGPFLLSESIGGLRIPKREGYQQRVQIRRKVFRTNLSRAGSASEVPPCHPAEYTRGGLVSLKSWANRVILVNVRRRRSLEESTRTSNCPSL